MQILPAGGTISSQDAVPGLGGVHEDAPHQTLSWESEKGILFPGCLQCRAWPPAPCFLLALCVATHMSAHHEWEVLSEALCAKPRRPPMDHPIGCPQNYGASFTPLHTREKSSQKFGALNKNQIAHSIGRDLNPSHIIPGLIFIPPYYSYGGEFRKPIRGGR